MIFFRITFYTSCNTTNTICRRSFCTYILCFYTDFSNIITFMNYTRIHTTNSTYMTITFIKFSSRINISFIMTSFYCTFICFTKNTYTTSSF